MNSFVTRSLGPKLLLTALIAIAVGIMPGHAAVTYYVAALNGNNEDPSNSSLGVGEVQIDIDPVAHTMKVRTIFSNLTGTTTVAHIHAATLVAGSGLAGPATPTPTLPGFPAGITSGNHDMTLDMTQASSYSADFLAANGDSPALAEDALFQAIAEGKAYFNIHTSDFGGGEIRGFFAPGQLTPTNAASWGRIKALYR